MCLQCREEESTAQQLLDDWPEELVVGIYSVNTGEAICPDCWHAGNRLCRGDLYPRTLADMRDMQCIFCFRPFQMILPVYRSALGKTWWD